MLLVGTTDHLEDVDRQLSLAEDVRVTAIARQAAVGVSPLMYALFDGDRVVRVDRDGVTPLARLGEPAGQSLIADSGSVVVGLAGARLALVDPQGGGVEPLPAFTAAPGREGWQNPAGPSPDLRSATVTESGAWLVNVHVGGVWRSVDEGRTWTGVLAPEVDVHEVVGGLSGRVVAAAAAGVGWSLDDGVTWQWTQAGLHAPYCRAVAMDGDVVYVTASTGPDTTDGRLYRGTIGGPMEPCANGVPPAFPFNLDTGTLDARGGAVALGTPDGCVYRSADQGVSFEQVTERVGGHLRVVRFG